MQPSSGTTTKSPWEDKVPSRLRASGFGGVGQCRGSGFRGPGVWGLGFLRGELCL